MCVCLIQILRQRLKCTGLSLLPICTKKRCVPHIDPILNPFPAHPDPPPPPLCLTNLSGLTNQHTALGQFNTCFVSHSTFPFSVLIFIFFWYFPQLLVQVCSVHFFLKLDSKFQSNECPPPFFTSSATMRHCVCVSPSLSCHLRWRSCSCSTS